MKLIKVSQPVVGHEEVRAVSKVILSGKYVSGDKVKEFEEKFADYLGVKHALAVNSGTAALHVSLAVLGVGPGDEVIVPPLTFFSTVASVLHQNAIPIFADIDKEGFCLNPVDVERKISKNTKVIIPVHLFGNSAQMDEIMSIAKNHNIRVLEDAAQAHGTEYRGKKVGSIGHIGIFSFYATKHMTTGEGGIIVTNNRKWAETARAIRSHGMTARDAHSYLGYNYRLTEMAAALGIAQLKKLDEINKQRIKNSLYLLEQLNKRNISWIKIPKLENHIKHTFFWCPIIIDEQKLGMTAKDLIVILRKKGIETRHRYWKPLYKQKILVEKSAYPREFPFSSKFYKKRVDYSKIYLKNAERIAGKIIGLPNHSNLTKSELSYIIDVLSKIK